MWKVPICQENLTINRKGNEPMIPTNKYILKVIKRNSRKKVWNIVKVNKECPSY